MTKDFSIVQLFDLLWCEPFEVARWEVLAHSPAVQIISIEMTVYLVDLF